MLCVSRSFTVSSRDWRTSGNSSCGNHFVMGSFHASLCSSTSMAMAIAVNALVVDMMPKSVWSSTAPAPASVRTPYPRAKITLSFFTIETERPGMPQSCTPFETNASSSLICAARSSAAFCAAFCTAARGGCAEAGTANENAAAAISSARDGRRRKRCITNLPGEKRSARQLRGIALVDSMNVDRETSLGVGRIEDVAELGAPHDFGGLVRRSRLHLVRKGLVDSRDEHEKLELGPAKVVVREAPERTLLGDRMHERPRERKEHHLRTLEREQLILPPDAGDARLEPAAVHASLEVDDLVVTNVEIGRAHV